MTWPQKAKRLSYYLRLLARVNGIRWNAMQMPMTKALRPTCDATSLTPLGGPMMAGLGRRPNWADRRTPKIAALNTWRAKEEQSRTVGKITLKERRTRQFADGWYLQMQGHKAQSRIHAHSKALKRDDTTQQPQPLERKRQRHDKEISRQAASTTPRALPSSSRNPGGHG